MRVVEKKSQPHTPPHAHRTEAETQTKPEKATLNKQNTETEIKYTRWTWWKTNNPNSIAPLHSRKPAVEGAEL